MPPRERADILHAPGREFHLALVSPGIITGILILCWAPFLIDPAADSGLTGVLGLLSLYLMVWWAYSAFLLASADMSLRRRRVAKLAFRFFVAVCVVFALSLAGLSLSDLTMSALRWIILSGIPAVLIVFWNAAVAMTSRGKGFRRPVVAFLQIFYLPIGVWCLHPKLLQIEQGRSGAPA